MKREPFRKFLQTGPVMILTLIGILLLSAVLYYRAVKIQRFLEPALAISTPRISFAKNIRNLLLKEFGMEQMSDIRFTTNSIFVERRLLLSGIHEPRSDSPTMKKLSVVFLSVLKDPDMRDYVDFILISAKFPANDGSEPDEKKRLQTQQRAEVVLNSLFRVSPELAKDYGTYFAATTVPVSSSEKDINWIEFRFIPSERLHIEVLKSLKKYVR